MKSLSHERRAGAVHMDDSSCAHGGRIDDISIYGQELNSTTWRLGKMNLAICGIDTVRHH